MLLTNPFCALEPGRESAAALHLDVNSHVNMRVVALPVVASQFLDVKGSAPQQIHIPPGIVNAAKIAGRSSRYDQAVPTSACFQRRPRAGCTFR